MFAQFPALTRTIAVLRFFLFLTARPILFCSSYGCDMVVLYASEEIAAKERQYEPKRDESVQVNISLAGNIRFPCN